MTSSLSLYELNNLVASVIHHDMPAYYWVRAELASVRESAGHGYLELVEKDAHSRTPIAKARANCWRNRWMAIRPTFERATGQRLREGMQVLLKVRATFHEAFGFAYNIDDIDPTFTLGDMARRRQEILRQLQAEGVMDLQRELPLPLFAQRIAVISSAGAAGYGDFAHQLAHNDMGLAFRTELFAATMQGEQVEQSVIAALDAIALRMDDFDAVVIIRGGGATSDLSGFDTLPLAENVANFPLPILTGIGHERDESVIDRVSHLSLKTPTAVAAYLVDRLGRVLSHVDELDSRMQLLARQQVGRQREHLDALACRIPVAFSLVSTQQRARIDALAQRMAGASTRLIAGQRHALDLLEGRMKPAMATTLQHHSHQLSMLAQRAQALDPKLLLARGYSITTCGDHIVTDATQLKPGDEITTRFEKGAVSARVEKVRKTHRSRS